MKRLFPIFLIAEAITLSLVYSNPSTASSFTGLGEPLPDTFGLNFCGKVYTRGQLPPPIALRNRFENGSWATGVSADGSTVVGWIKNNLRTEAFRWSQTGGMESLGGSFEESMATGVSADGSTVVGLMGTNSGSEAFRWTQTRGMESLGGSFESGATGVSADGSIVVGWMRTNSGTKPFRWTKTGGMESLGGSFERGATGVSADGSTVVGWIRTNYSDRI
ncbi:MAG: hypothetical protein AB4426_30770 [Xenococcaceae cyanobacterium]